MKILKEYYKEILLIFFIIFIVFLRTCANSIVNNKRIKNYNSEIKKWKDKDSVNHTKTKIIESQKIKYFLELKSKDSMITKLQKVVKNYKNKISKKGNVTLFSSNSKINNKSKTNITIKDTIIKNDTVYLYPEYKSDFNLKNWVIGNTISNKDTTEINLKIKNEYSVIIGNERKNIFSKNKPFVEIINYNPYTDIKNVKTYKVSTPRTKRIGIGPYVGIGLDGKYSIGIGVQYNIIKF